MLIVTNEVQLKNTIAFLERASLSGKEVPAFYEVMACLVAAKEEKKHENVPTN